jgi:hypothetical protein
MSIVCAHDLFYNLAMHNVGDYIDLTYLNTKPRTITEVPLVHREVEVGTRFLFVNFMPSFTRLRVA